jgi:putative spermidine/putrescine transport system permease protein
VLALYCSLYVGGLVLIGLTSIGYYSSSGNITLGYYGEVFSSPAIGATVARTLRVSLATVLVCLVIGFPVARYISSATGKMRGLVLMCVLSPLLVTSIGRIFGWIALFGPGSAVASLSSMLFGTKPTGLLYTEAAMVIGMSNLFLPFMVLSIAAAMAHLDQDLPKAAASLGARPMEVFLQVELPMSMPGIVGGVITVLCLSISNFATAALLGGSGRNVIANEIYLDVLIYFQQERGAALAVLLLATVIVLLTVALRLFKRKWSAATQD